MVQVLFFIIGAVIGSFLGVVIYRLPKRESVVYPPSHCVHCKHKLTWQDLIPLISFIFLLGKCRYCKQNISRLDPVIELISGVLFLVIYSVFSGYGIVNIIIYLMMSSILIVIFFTDLRYGIIPFQTVLVGTIASLIYLLYNFNPNIFLTHLISAGIAFALFLFLFLVTKGKGMGFGDVLLVFMMGLFLGFPNIAFALYLAFLTGAVASLLLVLIGSKRIRYDTIPFGPFLVTGTMISIFYGPKITELVRFFIPL